MKAQQYRLYSTSGCHLCELAEAMLEVQVAGREGDAYDAVDIAGSDELFKRYGLRIPVVAHPDGRELDWPFTPRELARFLAGAGEAGVTCPP